MTPTKPAARYTSQPPGAAAAAGSLREETQLVAVTSALFVLASFVFCGHRGWLLLYGDAVAHLHIARQIFDSLHPGLNQLGSVWLPLPHLLMLPFVQRTSWWQSGVAGSIPSMASYIFACVGLYRLARRWMRASLAGLVFVAFALNPGTLYMSVTAMTEPLFLALMIWSVVYLTAFESAVRRAHGREAQRALARLTAVLVAAVFTRYDGWILATLAWCMVVYWSARHQWWHKAGNTRVLVICTLLLAAAPTLWFLYNWQMSGDPLDFLRGPYSAQAILKRTSRPGALPYPGWHHLWWAFLYYIKSAKMGAAPPYCGGVLLLLAFLGTLYALWKLRSRAVPAALLFWMPVPFYTYSVAYGSVPIFIPVWFPHAFYNTRYGMELLPALALFPIFAVRAVLHRWPQRPRTIIAVAAAIIIASNAYLLHATPLVLQEAKVNARTRVPFEQALAAKLVLLPPQSTLLMYTSAHIGALQEIGFPLRQTINEGDYPQWQQGLKDPASVADFVVALDDDPVAEAVRQHPQNLDLLYFICSTGQPCARVYRSTVHTPQA